MSILTKEENITSIPEFLEILKTKREETVEIINSTKDDNNPQLTATLTHFIQTIDELHNNLEGLKNKPDEEVYGNPQIHDLIIKSILGVASLAESLQDILEVEEVL